MDGSASAMANALSTGTEQRLLVLVQDGLARSMGTQQRSVLFQIRRLLARIENRAIETILLNRIKASFPLLDQPEALTAMLQRYRSGYLSGKFSTLSMASQPARRLPEVEDAPVDSYWLTQPRKDRGVLLYTAGGGFILPASQRQINCAEQFAEHAQCDGILNGHRLAPEHPFPKPIEDTVALYRWLLEQYRPEQITFSADTAGASITLGALQVIRRENLPQPACVVLFSPWMDLSLSGWSYITKSSTSESPFRMETAAFCARAYLGDHMATDPLASAIYADLEGMPPLAIHTSRSDMHFDDALRLVENANHAGVTAEINYWDSPRHHLERFNDAQAKQSLSLAAKFVQRMMAG